MSVYMPRGNSLHVVQKGDVWMIHDDHGEYDGPWDSKAKAWAYVHDCENFNRESRERYKRTGHL